MHEKLLSQVSCYGLETITIRYNPRLGWGVGAQDHRGFGPRQVWNHDLETAIEDFVALAKEVYERPKPPSKPQPYIPSPTGNKDSLF